MYKFHNLKNQYIIWRHGESGANQRQVIASKLENDSSIYGLTEFGQKQVLLSMRKVNLNSSSIVLFSSPFRRCLETANLISKKLKVRYFIHYSLGERCFGNLEGLHKIHYQLVYKSDQYRNSENLYNAESVWSVQKRLISFTKEVENIYSGKTIILVTHADVGEIFQTMFEGFQPYLHRQLPKLRNAEVRVLQLRY